MGQELWSIQYDVVGFDGIVSAFRTYLQEHRSELVRASLDALSDDKDLPPEVEDARQQLVENGEEREGRAAGTRRRWWQRGGDPQMAIELDLREASDFALFETFGPYSIEALAYASQQEDEDPVVYVHDSGSSLLLALNQSEVHAFASRAQLPVEGIVDLETARRRAKEQRKRQR